MGYSWSTEIPCTLLGTVGGSYEQATGSPNRRNRRAVRQLTYAAWQTIPASTSDDLNGISFANSTRGAIVGAGGTILGTNNAGATWTPQQSPTTQPLNAVVFFKDTVGVAVGAQNTILRTSSGVTWVAWDGEAPNEYKLTQNYPNPFNPSTTIKYELPKSSEIRLSVFDLLGPEAAVLVDERTEAGVHEVKFDASNLSTGVYLYRLTAGSFVQTRNLLLLKQLRTIEEVNKRGSGNPEPFLRWLIFTRWMNRRRAVEQIESTSHWTELTARVASMAARNDRSISPRQPSSGTSKGGSSTSSFSPFDTLQHPVHPDPADSQMSSELRLD